MVLFFKPHHGGPGHVDASKGVEANNAGPFLQPLVVCPWYRADQNVVNAPVAPITIGKQVEGVFYPGTSPGPQLGEQDAATAFMPWRGGNTQRFLTNRT